MTTVFRSLLLSLLLLIAIPLLFFTFYSIIRHAEFSDDISVDYIVTDVDNHVVYDGDGDDGDDDVVDDDDDEELSLVHQSEIATDSISSFDLITSKKPYRTVLSQGRYFAANDEETAIIDCFNANATRRRQPRHLKTSYEFDPRDPVVVFDNAIDELDLHQINALTECLQMYGIQVSEDRKFGLKNEYGGGNAVTYLTGFMQLVMPEFTDHIISISFDASRAAKWLGEDQNPYNLGIRTSEKIEYFEGGELLMHYDEGSVFTLVLMMSKPEDFEGGMFFVEKYSDPPPGSQDGFELLPENRSPPPASQKEKEIFKNFIGIMPPYLGGVIINSTSIHGVTKVTAGHRAIFALEFWTYCSATISDRRPSPSTIIECSSVR